MSQAEVVIDEAQWSLFRKAIARGLFLAGTFIEGEAKLLTPVHGDPDGGGIYKSRAPGEKPIGGTLRRSIHTVVYIDGQRQFAGTAGQNTGTDQNSETVPSYSTGRGIEAFVGTNVFYALFVHDGTVKMVERPFLGTAFNNSKDKLVPYLAEGFRSVFGTTP